MTDRVTHVVAAVPQKRTATLVPGMLAERHACHIERLPANSIVRSFAYISPRKPNDEANQWATSHDVLKRQEAVEGSIPGQSIRSVSDSRQQSDFRFVMLRHARD